MYSRAAFTTTGNQNLIKALCSDPVIISGVYAECRNSTKNQFLNLNHNSTLIKKDQCCASSPVSQFSNFCFVFRELINFGLFLTRNINVLMEGLQQRIRFCKYWLNNSSYCWTPSSCPMIMSFNSWLPCSMHWFSPTECMALFQMRLVKQESILKLYLCWIMLDAHWNNWSLTALKKKYIINLVLGWIL